MKLSQPELDRPRVEIIPMIDTIFFLLVFFMMASLSMVPLAARHVRLPDSETAALRPRTQVVVTLSGEGTYALDHQPIAEMAILPRLRPLIRATPNLTVVINCDRRQPVSRFLRMFDLIKQANPGSVMVATQPRPVQPSPGSARGTQP